MSMQIWTINKDFIVANEKYQSSRKTTTLGILKKA